MSTQIVPSIDKIYQEDFRKAVFSKGYTTGGMSSFFFLELYLLNTFYQLKFDKKAILKHIDLSINKIYQ